MKIRRRDVLALALSAPAASGARNASDPLTRDELVYGGGAAPPRRMELRAGPLSLVFEPESGQVRYVRAGDTEVLRAIYAAVRDRNWGTILPEISNLRIEQEPGRFRLTFTATCKAAPVDFVWQGVLTGEQDGTLKFDFDGAARSAFLRNRIGFCVLHAADAAGKAVRVEKVSGETAAGAFPSDIAPNQPFFGIRALTHAVAPSVEAEVRMTGDTFEMEDQRNWTDASFKTYCTPLELPYPVEIKAGDRVRQSVAVRLRGASALAARQADSAGPVELRLDSGPSRPLPLLGLGVSSVVETLSAKEAALVKRLAPSHLRVDLPLSQPGFVRRLEAASDQARALGTRLEAAFYLDRNPEEELRALADAVTKTKAPVRHFLVFHRRESSTTAKWLDLARKHLAASAPGAKFAAGTDAYFTELNRGRPPAAAADCVTYSINPQVHAFDNPSLVETLEMQAASLASARKFCGSLPLFVSPVTLKPRFNPNATEAAAAARGPLRDLPAEVDARQPSLFTAAWTAGSLKHLAEGGAASVTYYETAGWRGVLETAAGSPLADKFPSKAGAVFPVYHVLAEAADFKGGEVAPVKSSRTQEVEALLLRRQGRRRLIVANLTDQTRVARITGGGAGASWRVRMLDEYSAADAIRKPDEFWARRGALREAEGGVLQIALLPYGVAFGDA